MIAKDAKLNPIDDFSLTEDRWAEMRRKQRVQTSLAGRLGYGARSLASFAVRFLTSQKRVFASKSLCLSILCQSFSP
jgi:hypothetical protein